MKQTEQILRNHAMSDKQYKGAKRSVSELNGLLSRTFDPKQNRIVCAACLSKCGKHMVLGVRHWDTLMHTAVGLMKDDGLKINWSGGSQGFVDRNRNYLSREKAWKVAEDAGQILRRCGGDDSNGGTLYSENLY